jgi:signal transduction histidine kinase
LPSFGADIVLSTTLLEDGPLGVKWLRPQALFGITGIDPTVHAVLWSFLLNTSGFILGSLVSFPRPLERLQGAQFVNVFANSGHAHGWSGSAAQSEDLMVMAQRILGGAEAQKLFRREAKIQGHDRFMPEPTPDFVQRLEREMSASVGAATAHAMVSQLVGGASVSVQDLMAVADESAQMLEYSNQLEAKSSELLDTAKQLRDVNAKLTQISVQKDAFLSQISHELRTPMTSIRSFSEILRDGHELKTSEHTKYASIINVEAIRLTRLLDDLLDLTVLENGQVSLNMEIGSLFDAIKHAVTTTKAGSTKQIKIDLNSLDTSIKLHTDLDRLAQVFINLISNAQKYCKASDPELFIEVIKTENEVCIFFTDNGLPIPVENHALIFEKFSRINDQDGTGAGLGLAICREIMIRLGGGIDYVPTVEGNRFVLRLPV